MSVYRPKRSDGSLKSRVYHYDFRLCPKAASASVRFHGSTGQTSKPAARRVEAKLRERAATGELSSGMTINQACWRYWGEMAGRGSPKTDELLAKSLENLRRLIGREMLLVDISPDDVSKAVRHRRAEPVVRGSGTTGKLVSNATVNRTLTEPLRKLLRRARKVWNVPVDIEAIPWGHLILPEPVERVREMTSDEESAFWAALRADYHPIVTCYLFTGLRKAEVLGLKRTAFHPRDQVLTVRGKGDRPRRIHVTPILARTISAELARHGLDAIWTYIVQRGQAKGKRRPITASGLRRQIGKALMEAGIENFRIHDLRHTFASRLLRSNRNLKLVQIALGHRSIDTTVKYAHVLDDEVAAGIDEMAASSRNYPGTAKVGKVRDAE